MRAKRVVWGIGLLLTACSRQETPTGGDFEDLPADMIMVGMTQHMTNGGLRKAELKGDTAYVYDDSGKVVVKGVHLLIFNEQGAQTAKLTSKSGDFNTYTQAMIARGNVVLITTVGNRRIETQELHYDPTSHRLWSDSATLMVEGGSRITGSGFTADDKFTNVQIKGAAARGLKVQF